MAEAPNTNSTLALTKKVYGEDLSKLEFENGIVGELCPFTTKNRLGDTYNFTVALTMEHGFLANGTTGAVVSMPESVASITKQATVSAYETLGKARIGSRIMNDAVAAGPAAFADATEVVLHNAMASAEYREEHSLIYGQSGLFKVSGNSSGVLTITDATWSAALADGLENAILEAFDGTGATANQHNADLVVSAVDLVNKTITVTGTSAAVVANDILYFKGYRTTTAHKDMLGLFSLASTVTGTVNGISCTDYSRWRPNTKASFGAVEWAKFLTEISRLTGRRIRKKEMNLLVPVAAFDRIASDLQSSRRYDNVKKGAVAGFETLEFYSSLGLTKIVPHAMLRDGDAIAFSGKNAFRTGSKPLGWDTPPNGDKAEIWRTVDGSNAYEARIAHIQAPAFLRPHEVLSITGITYS